MEKHTLKVQPRTIIGRKVKVLRGKGLVPANIYGKSTKSQSIQVDEREFAKTFQQVGESTVLYLQVESEKDTRPTLVRQVVYHPVSGKILHIDFNQVNLKEKIKAPVALELTGEAPAVRESLGILVQQMQEVEVEALPTEMPEHISVDISGLTEVNQAIYVKDLRVGAKLTVTEDPEQIVVKIEKLAAEEKVEAPASAEATAGEPAIEGQPAEGEAPSSDQPAKPVEPAA